MRALWFPAVASLIVGAAVVITAQAPEPSFEVVSIKRNVSTDLNLYISPFGGPTFEMRNVPLFGTVSAAYEVRNIEGAPDWLRSDRYDIVAKAAGKPTNDETRAMLRTMLKERMKLAAHVEARETQVYALVVVRPGHPGLIPFTRDCGAIEAERDAARRAGQPQAPPSPTSALPCAYTWSSAIYSGGITLAQLAGMLDYVAGRVVVDRTGLPGRYEFTLRFASPTGPISDSSDAPPVLFTALQEQLGLGLDATRAPVNTLVIDHIERPTDN